MRRARHPLQGRLRPDGAGRRALPARRQERQAALVDLVAPQGRAPQPDTDMLVHVAAGFMRAMAQPPGEGEGAGAGLLSAEQANALDASGL